MRFRPFVIAALLLAAAGCARDTNVPSLARRPAEAIDPRVPIPSEVVSGPPAAAVRARVAALIDAAQGGQGSFDPLMASAERLAAGAGAQGSESWVAAQEALSAAISARAPVAKALGDIDSLAADALQHAGTIPPGDLDAVQRGAATIQSLDERQAARIAEVQRRLAR